MSPEPTVAPWVALGIIVGGIGLGVGELKSHLAFTTLPPPIGGAVAGAMVGALCGRIIGRLLVARHRLMQVRVRHREIQEELQEQRKQIQRSKGPSSR